MNRLALLLATSTLFAASLLPAPAHAQQLGFAQNPGICMVHPLAEARLVPGTREWRYRREIRAGTEGICANFNGAFTVVTFDDGEGNEIGVIVDRTDGRVYWLPDRATFGYGFEFHGESNELVVNAFISQQLDGPADVPVDVWRKFYLFENGKWRLTFQDKGFAPSME